MTVPTTTAISKWFNRTLLSAILCKVFYTALYSGLQSTKIFRDGLRLWSRDTFSFRDELRLWSRDTLFRDELKLGSRVTLSLNLTVYAKILQYKYFNNILGLNTRVSKFIAGYSAECTFCVASKEPLPINSEGFLHLFFECPYGSKYRNIAERDFFAGNSSTKRRKQKKFLAAGPGTGRCRI